MVCLWPRVAEKRRLWKPCPDSLAQKAPCALISVRSARAMVSRFAFIVFVEALLLFHTSDRLSIPIYLSEQLLVCSRSVWSRSSRFWVGAAESAWSRTCSLGWICAIHTLHSIYHNGRLVRIYYKYVDDLDRDLFEVCVIPLEEELLAPSLRSFCREEARATSIPKTRVSDQAQPNTTCCAVVGPVPYTASSQYSLF